MDRRGKGFPWLVLGIALLFCPGTLTAQVSDVAAGVTVDPDLRAAATDLLAMARFEEIHAPPAGKAGPAAGQGAVANAFYDHVLGGIRSSQERGPVYDRLSGGDSRRILRKLTLFQRAFLPLAWLVDRRAHRFQRRGIPIVSGDLMPVAGLPAPETPPRWRGKLAAGPARQLKDDLKAYKHRFWDRVQAADFHAAARLTWETLQMVKAVEEREGCHLAMVKHFLESLGLGALHAVRYVRDSHGEVIPLAKAFLAIQMMPLGNTLPMDLDAQALHARGIGLLVNDVPAIPFEAEWQRP
ncbi:MAG: hypothetical protein GX442_25780 [Candidatus Riflebacteria bacterium]|nr:hypothetical protein [Candidatus Riflebacteria bacterium]